MNGSVSGGGAFNAEGLAIPGPRNNVGAGQGDKTQKTAMREGERPRVFHWQPATRIHVSGPDPHLASPFSLALVIRLDAALMTVGRLR
jgi:hypothetical protein